MLHFLKKLFKVEFTNKGLDKVTINLCKLRGTDVFCLMGSTFDGDDNHIYYITMPKVVTNIPYKDDLYTILKKSFEWMLLISKGFSTGFGNNLKNNDDELKSSMKPCDWNTDHWGTAYNWFFKNIQFVRDALEEVGWNGTTETAILASKKLKEAHNAFYKQ